VSRGIKYIFVLLLTFYKTGFGGIEPIYLREQPIRTKNLWFSIGGVASLCSSKIFPGAYLDVSYYYSPRLGIGFSFTGLEAIPTTTYNFTVKSPGLQLNQFMLVNRFRIINKDLSKLDFFLNSGYSGITIVEKTNNVPFSSYKAVVIARNDFLMLEPGLKWSFRPNNNWIWVSTGVSYRFLVGGAAFGTSQEFMGPVAYLGISGGWE
jgi:hypothetical protein